MREGPLFPRLPPSPSPGAGAKRTQAPSRLGAAAAEVAEAYSQLWGVVKLRAVWALAGLLLTYRLGGWVKGTWVHSMTMARAFEMRAAPWRLAEDAPHPSGQGYAWPGLTPQPAGPLRRCAGGGGRMEPEAHRQGRAQGDACLPGAVPGKSVSQWLAEARGQSGGGGIVGSAGAFPPPAHPNPVMQSQPPLAQGPHVFPAKQKPKSIVSIFPLPSPLAHAQFPVELLSAVIAGRWAAAHSPTSPFLAGYWARLAVAGAAVWLTAAFPAVPAGKAAEVMAWGTRGGR